MPNIIAIANQKGGVGKTTTALNLCAELVRKGKKVLAIDLDSQGNLTDYLGHDNDNAPTITDMMSAITSGHEANPQSVILTNKDGIDYIPSNITLSSADYFLLQAISRETVLKRFLEHEYFSSYEYIIIDCLPSLGILLVNALTACTDALVPVQTQKFSLNGLEQLFNIIFMVKNTLNSQLNILGILLTMHDRTNISNAVAEAVKNRYDGIVFENYISRSVEAVNSSYTLESLVSGNHKIGGQYRDFTEELLGKGN